VFLNVYYIDFIWSLWNACFYNIRTLPIFLVIVLICHLSLLCEMQPEFNSLSLSLYYLVSSFPLSSLTCLDPNYFASMYYFFPHNCFLVISSLLLPALMLHVPIHLLSRVEGLPVDNLGFAGYTVTVTPGN
jgi:hypothetical protein